ncbi:MAG: ABC transporter permease [Nannocystaceae bacterium]|nr:ABC transporter permease [Nannocystaceae bacterium]
MTEVSRIVSYATLCVITCGAMVRRPAEGARVVWSQVARQIIFSAWDAVPLVGLIAALMTMTGIAMMATLAPAVDTPAMLGGILASALVRELAPLMTAIIVALRSCSAVTVELGYMSWRGEVEALETLGIDPTKFLLLPRFVGLIAAVVGLTLVFVIATLASGAAAAYFLEVGPSLAHLATRLYTYVTPTDIAIATLKSLAFGLIIASVSCYHGLSVRRDISQIPRRTTRALVEALVHCTAINMAITLIVL